MSECLAGSLNHLMVRRIRARQRWSRLAHLILIFKSKWHIQSGAPSGAPLTRQLHSFSVATTPDRGEPYLTIIFFSISFNILLQNYCDNIFIITFKIKYILFYYKKKQDLFRDLASFWSEFLCCFLWTGKNALIIKRKF